MYEIGDEYEGEYELVGDEYELVGDEYEYEDDYDEELDAMLGFSPFQMLRRGGRGGARRPTRRRPQRQRARGGRRRRPSLIHSAEAAAYAAKRAEAATLMRNVGPRKSREFPIGFDSVAAVVAGAAANINQQPQIIFRPERILVPASIGNFFQITDVRVGKDSQLVAAGALPAVVFSETAFGVRLKMDTCQISQLLILQTLNIDLANHRFMAAMIGESVEF